MACRAIVDKESCQSSGRCVEAAAEAFRFDADHLAEALPGAGLERSELLAIARACPAIAIRVLDEDGSELDF